MLECCYGYGMHGKPKKRNSSLVDGTKVSVIPVKYDLIPNMDDIRHETVRYC